MLSIIPLSAVAAATIFAFFLSRCLRSRGSELPGIFLWQTVVLPFAAGGFHTYTAAITAVLLAGNLIVTVKRNGRFLFVYNLNSAAIVCVVAAYLITPFWAADKGMAVFGIPRFIAVLLYCLTLMQLTPGQKSECLSLVPLSGAIMTVVSSVLLLFPNTDAYLTVNGRLSGFMQYPNSFAAFLLAGIILQYTKETRKKTDYILDAILILGVVLSGSKTGFILLIAALLGIIIIRKSKKVLITLIFPVVLGAILALAVSRFDVLRHADRFAAISANSSSFLVRLLYFKDVIPQILKNPFGYGYMGYRALEGTFQTGRYYVTYIHNGLLQLLFEIGWFPALLLAGALLRTMLSRNTAPRYRLLLTIVLGHCMLDFDMQYLITWIIVLSCLDFETGKRYSIRKGKSIGAAACAGMMIICIWLGAGELLCHLQKTEISLRITPFHTDALSAQMQKTTDIDEQEALADKILKLNPTYSLAYSAKANIALSRGDISEMIGYKERAILCARYTTAEYTDYFDKLYVVMQMYLQAGDTKSAMYCREKILGIADAMQKVSQAMDPLAFKTGEDTSLELPFSYRLILKQLAAELE